MKQDDLFDDSIFEETESLTKIQREKFLSFLIKSSRVKDTDKLKACEMLCKINGDFITKANKYLVVKSEVEELTDDELKRIINEGRI
jgi:phage terminase small subunit